MAITSNGDIVVSQYQHDCVTLYNKEGDKIRSFGSYGTKPGQFHDPSGVVVTADSHVLVVDSGNKRIQKLTMTGEHVTSVSSHFSGLPQFGDHMDSLYISQERYSLLTLTSVMSKSSMLVLPFLTCLAVVNLLKESSNALSM